MITEQQQVIYSMIAQNTGRDMLDSGGAYGRHWERNQKKTVEDFINEDVITIEPCIYNGNRLELNERKSLFHHLDANLSYDKDMNELWYRFDEHFPDKYWDGKDGTMNMFFQWASKYDSKYHNHWDFKGEQYSGYTYNEENILSQDFVYHIMGGWVFIQSHNGCDARGGFSRPVLFQTTDDGRLNDVSNFTISCTNGHFWDFNGGYEETEQDMCIFESHNLPKVECIDANDSEFLDIEGDYNLQLKEWMANKRAYELSDPLPGMDKPGFVCPPELLVGKVLLKDGKIYCPVCGEELQPYCY